MNRQPNSILITGASSGIGYALARAYAAPGKHLALCGRSVERLEEIAGVCKSLGANVTTQQLDLQEQDATSEWVLSVDQQTPIDLVIANAGISSGTGQKTREAAQTNEIFSVNVTGTLNTVLPLIEQMKSRGHGQIALMSSMAAFRGLPTAPAYSASKAAIRSYGEGLRGRLAGDGIHVTVICPGFVRSRITDQNAFKMPFFMEADRAAQIILKGLAKNKPRIAFPWQTYFLMRFISALPLSWTDTLLNKGPHKI